MFAVQSQWTPEVRLALHLYNHLSQRGRLDFIEVPTVLLQEARVNIDGLDWRSASSEISRVKAEQILRDLRPNLPFRVRNQVDALLSSLSAEPRGQPPPAGRPVRRSRSSVCDLEPNGSDLLTRYQRAVLYTTNLVKRYESSSQRIDVLIDRLDGLAQRYSVPLDWMVTAMSIESRGRSDAVSPEGAGGLFQLMPFRVKEICEGAWKRDLTQDDRQINQYNIILDSARRYGTYSSRGRWTPLTSFEHWLPLDQNIFTRAYFDLVTPINSDFRFRDPAHLYMALVAPSYLKQIFENPSQDFVVYARNTAAASANPGLDRNKDGNIMYSEIYERVADEYFKVTCLRM